MYAHRDAEAIPKLVDMLDDPDQAVRMYAIIALRRLCGEDFGYRFYENAMAREAAIQRWRDALRAGDVRLKTAGPRAGTNADNEEPSGGAPPEAL